MLFVPLPLFAVLLLVLILIRFVASRDMTIRAHQFFVALVALYAAQSLCVTLRWGYGIAAAGQIAGAIAPVLPVLAWLSFRALTRRLRLSDLWPLLLVGLTWAVLVISPLNADPIIIALYLGFGAALLAFARKGPDMLTFAPLQNAQEIHRAMVLTGATLIAAAITDNYLIFDFITNDGANAPAVITFVQTAFVILIGLAASLARSASPEQPAQDPAPAPEASDADAAILLRIEALFEAETLYKDDELSLRRLARRIGVPDRQVSNAINRIRGVSVSQFVNEFRVREACARLARSDDSVLAISLAAGFATKSNFNREFQRIMGTSPSAWRAANRESVF